MVVFNPPEFKTKVDDAIRVWREWFPEDYRSEFYDRSVADLYMAISEGRDKAHEVDEISPDTILEIWLWDEMDGESVTYQQFTEIVDAANTGKLDKDAILIDGSVYQQLIAPSSARTNEFFEVISPENEMPEVSAWRQQVRQIEERMDELHEALVNEQKLLDEKGEAEGRSSKRLDELRREIWEAMAQQNSISEPIDHTVHKYCTMVSELHMGKVTCSLKTGVTAVMVGLAKINEIRENFPFGLDHYITLELSIEGVVSRQEVEDVKWAYLFELDDSLDLQFSILNSLVVLVEESTHRFPERLRFRPLLRGSGMEPLLRLYHRAATHADDEVAILYFAKVVEFVSQTVIRQRATSAIRTKLLSQHALDPSAEFIQELEKIVDDNRPRSQKDRDAAKAALLECCEPTEFKNLIPEFLMKRKKKNQDEHSGESDIREKIAGALSSTRNQIAHAKANYQPTGEECPPEQYAAFVKLARIVARQVIRWYGDQPERTRVV